MNAAAPQGAWTATTHHRAAAMPSQRPVPVPPSVARPGVRVLQGGREPQQLSLSLRPAVVLR